MQVGKPKLFWVQEPPFTHGLYIEQMVVVGLVDTGFWQLASFIKSN